MATPARPDPTTSAPVRRAPVDYQINWLWADEPTPTAPKTDTVRATDAIRAVTRLVTKLSIEYAGVRDNLVVLDVVRS